MLKIERTKQMTQQELNACLLKAKYNRMILERMFPNMFRVNMMMDDGGYGDDRYQGDAEEERYSQEGN